MRRLFISSSAAFALALGLGAPAIGGPIEDGKTAFAKGDFGAAEKTVEPLAQSGNVDAEALLGMSLLFGPDANAEQAVAWLTKASNGGNGDAAYALGLAYLQGMGGIRQDPRASIQWFRLAAQRGGESEAYALLWLSTLYQSGLGDPGDKATIADLERKAATELEAAAAKGSVGAKSRLATMYHRGEGVPKDEAKATQLLQEIEESYRRRAERGDVMAQMSLAKLYDSGHGAPADGVQAMYWLLRAADQGDRNAQGMLWLHYWNISQSVDRANIILGDDNALSDQDKIEAYVWNHLSGLSAQFATMFPEVAKRPAVESKSDLSQSEKVTADGRIATWRPSKESPLSDGRPVEGTVTQKIEADRLAAEARRLDYALSPEAMAKARKRAEAYDVALGADDAKVTLVAYLLAPCTHCAKWYNAEFDKFKRAYIDTGRVRFVVRELDFEDRGVSNLAFMLARCRGLNSYFSSLGEIYRYNSELFRPMHNLDELAVFAKAHLGMDRAAFDSCVNDTAAVKALEDRSRVFQLDLQAALTFVVNGKIVTDISDPDAWKKAVDTALIVQ